MRRLSEILEQLLGYKGVKQALKLQPVRTASGPVLPMHFRKGGVSLKLFTTIATLGTALEIAAQELRIECLFPMDREAAALLRNWVAETLETVGCHTPPDGVGSNS